MTHTLALWAYITIYLIALWGIWHYHKNQETIKVGTGSIAFPLIVILLLTYGANWWEFSKNSPSGIEAHVQLGPHAIAISVLIVLIIHNIISDIVRKRWEEPVTRRRATLVTIYAVAVIATAVYGAGWV